MYLWNYNSNELGENNQPIVTSIGYYDETTNTVICSYNEKKWQVSVPQEIVHRDTLLLYIVLNVPQFKDYLDYADQSRLFNPVITEITPVEHVSEESAEPINETPGNTNENLKVIKCENCGLFYNAASYERCPFCRSEDSIDEASNNDEIEKTGGDDDSAAEIATVRMLINGELHALNAIGDGETITIGRSEECNIYYGEEKQLSRIHCTVQYIDAEKAFYVTDKSLNGIFDTTGNRLPKDTTIKLGTNSTLWIANKNITLQLTAATTADKNSLSENPKQYICNNCHGEYTPDSTFCPWCGNNVSNANV